MPSIYSRSDFSGKVIAIINVLNIVNFFVLWFIPIIRQTAFTFLNKDISMASVAYELYRTDILLFIIVSSSVTIVPMAKSAIYVYIWFFAKNLKAWPMATGALLGKISMLDIFIYAVFIVLMKGQGLVSITILPGMYLYIAAALISLAVGMATERRYRLSVLS